MAQNVLTPIQQLFDSSGSPYSGGKMYIYETGTTTEIALYSDEALTTPIANPIVADAAGVFAQAFIGASYAKFKAVVKDADDVTLYSRDPVYSISNASSFAAENVTFDGSGIGFSATNVQDAIEESIDVITENPTFKDSADNTKEVTFDLSSITTATERTVTWPDATGNVMLTSAPGTLSAGMNCADQVITRPKILDYSETYYAIGSAGGGTQDIDIENGNVQSVTIDTSETTLTFSNPPASGSAGCLTLIITNGGSQTLNWPASVDWPSGTAPTLQSSGVDVITFLTVTGGTTWYGFPGGLAMS